jgi:predicted DNA binding CopG/RHH family protein
MTFREATRFVAEEFGFSVSEVFAIRDAACKDEQLQIILPEEVIEALKKPVGFFDLSYHQYVDDLSRKIIAKEMEQCFND